MKDTSPEDIYVRSLNPTQLEAVTYCDGPSLVIAGAGSGKTRVLTYKIAYLLQHGYQPWELLSLTFTNKAAREMNERISAIIPDLDTRDLWSGTFHSIFSRLLRREAPALGFTSNYTIYDTADSRSLLKTIVREKGLDEKAYKPSVVACRISEAKNKAVLPGAYSSDGSIRRRDRADGMSELHAVYATYQQRLRLSDAMDFDDLLLNTYLLLKDHPETCRHYAGRFRYILIDEYQDTNPLQALIIRLLTRPDSRICVVGDDAQSIYGFRGADIDNILQFTHHYPTARLIKLETNYRSTQTIVNAANSIIRHNQRQIPKTVRSNGDVGTPLRLLSTYSDKEESIRVAGEIYRLRTKENIPFDNIALLYRTNAQSRSFEETFRTENIPYRIYGGLSFYQRKEIKDILAYFRLTANLSDEEAFRRIINYPARGIGATTQNKLHQAALLTDASPFQVAADPAGHGLELPKSTTAKLERFVTLISDFRKRLTETDGYTLAAEIIRKSGIGADIHADTTPESLARQENVQELLNSIKRFQDEQAEETGNQLISLTDFLAQVSLLTDTDRSEEDSGPCVTLMTVHAAKGLEFDAVFVTGLEEDLFPNATARYSQREMEEERRLFYVAVTRARRHVVLTYARSRYRYGNMECSAPSPFLREISKEYIGSGSSSGTQNLAANTAVREKEAPHPASPNRHYVRLQPDSSACTKANRPAPSGADLPQTGQTIEHERFGKGTILGTEGSGENAKATVAFENAGTKTLLLKFARFRIVE
ncbi:MAG TPA: 3'-5' exonuclease [Alloprevotella sp.]|nr:3'-5' exonuclease [Alloprevotella sp.]